MKIEAGKTYKFKLDKDLTFVLEKLHRKSPVLVSLENDIGVRTIIGEDRHTFTAKVIQCNYREFSEDYEIIVDKNSVKAI